uniref:Uncharacterized protein n=1 Tax=Rhizophora mucronata TaxID=61149 RepID=A0A2P2QRC3_RHIMU
MFPCFSNLTTAKIGLKTQSNLFFIKNINNPPLGQSTKKGQIMAYMQSTLHLNYNDD